jgi:CBS domain-containing membrane protein
MLATQKPLSALTAADVMSREVIAVPDEMTLQDAAHLLTRESISGAPVVNAKGACIGVLSVNDFFRWFQDDRLEISPSYEVSTLMTTDPVTVGPATPIRDLARMMVDGHIHRLVVVDGQRRPVGVVTSTDLLAALMNRADSAR